MLAIVALAFLTAFFSILPIKLTQMGLSEFWVFEVIPLPYWIAVIVLVAAIFFMVPHLDQRKFQFSFLVSCILLITCFRMAFPTMFTSVPAYEPDASNYMNTISAWIRFGIEFNVQGTYQWNFPLSFVTAYAIIKLGVPIDTFYRMAPFVIYAFQMFFLYLIIKEITPKDKRSIIPALSVFLFAISSVGYWVTVHYCPDLFGSLMFFVSLYLGLRLAKSETWNATKVVPVLASIFLLILSHHLSTLYMIFTFAGFALSCYFFKPAFFKDGVLKFLILSIYTYTAWFVYGTLMYPDFFNVYVYFSGYTDVGKQIAVGGLSNTFAFVVYPLFIFILSSIAIFSMLKIRNPFSLLRHTKEKLRNLRQNESNNPLIVFLFGFCCVIVLFTFGLLIPSLFGARILEVLLIGLYPFASLTLTKLMNNSSSRRLRLLMLILLLIIVIIDIYRYDSQIQRRVTVPS